MTKATRKTKKTGKKGQKRPRVGQSNQTDSLKKTRHIKRPYSMSHDSQYLTQAEKDALFAAITSVRDRAMFRIIYHRGLRSAEAGLLKMSDWNERDSTLFVTRGKGSESAAYTLLPEEARMLRAWLKIRGRAPGPLFPSRQKRAGGLGIHRNQLDRLFRRYCAEAGIRPEKAHMHALKHSCGTHLAERGNDSETIKHWLGHRALSSTQVYLHFSKRRRDEAWERNKDWK